MVEADIYFRPLQTSLLDIYKVFEPLVCCLKGIQDSFDRNNAGQYIAAGYDACTKAMHKSQLPNMWRCGAEQVEVKCLNSFVSEPTLYPT
jgi:hypothetical protein